MQRERRRTKVLQKSRKYARLGLAIKNVFLAFFCLLVLSTPAQARRNGPTVTDAPDRDISAELGHYRGSGRGSLYLTVLGNDLFGELHDIDSGSIGFQQTDVSLPGNNSLPVEFTRRTASTSYYAQTNSDSGSGKLSDGPLGVGWEIALPYVMTRWKTEGHHNYGQCGLPDTQLSNIDGNIIIGRKMRLFDGGEQNLGSPYDQAEDGPHGAWTYATPQWNLAACITDSLSGGYYARDRRGNSYTLDHRMTEDAGRVTGNYGRDSKKIDLPMTLIRYFPTQVEDANGNWVRYEYNSHGPTRIWSNDGREIRIAYDSGRVSSVTANGREWLYSYEAMIANRPDDYALSRIELPDDRYWELSPVITSIWDSMCAKRAFNGDIRTITMRHPSGTIGSFQTGAVKSNTWNVPSNPTQRERTTFGGPIFVNGVSIGRGQRCSWGAVSPKMLTTIGLEKKTLTLSNGDERIWRYIYSASTRPWNDDVNDLVATKYDRTRVRAIIDPTGSVTRYTLDNDWILGVGDMISTEVFTSVDVDEVNPIRKTVYSDQVTLRREAGNSISDGSFPNQVRKPTKIVTMQDGDIYTTELEYLTDHTNTKFSFFEPAKTTYKYSYDDTHAKVVETEYTSNRAKWITNLPARHMINGKEVSRTDYDTYGRPTKIYRYGTLSRSISYHSSGEQGGTVSSVSDAIQRQITLDNWKRGVPKKITRPDGQVEYQVVDDNGWVTSETDTLGKRTNYDYDIMGRLTEIAPPDGFSKTSISYDFSAPAGITQKIDKGLSRTTVVHNSMQQPILRRTEALDTGWSSYVNTRYDALGRVDFTSQPSTSTTESAGVEHAYDALGRPLSQRETVSPFATTTYAYLKGNGTRVTDPLGKHVDTFLYGWDGPGAGPTRKIRRHDSKDSEDATYSETTHTVHNVFGELTEVRRKGTTGVPDRTQRMRYDDRGRLCRYDTDEGGSTLYAYNDANEITAYAKGLPWTDNCVEPDGETLVTFARDAMGRVTGTDYADADTPDISKRYDAKGRLLEVVRGSTRRAFAYNAIDLVTDDDTFLTSPHTWTRRLDNRYNANGHLTAISHISGRRYDYYPDALGRTQAVVMRGSYAQPTLTIFDQARFHVDGSVANIRYGTQDGVVPMLYERHLDERQLTDRVKVSRPGYSAMDMAYSYTARGRVKTITDSVNATQSRRFGYDGLGQLTHATNGVNGWGGSWGSGRFTYDIHGNLKFKSMLGRNVRLRYDARNRLDLFWDGGLVRNKVVRYDDRGNTTKYGDLEFTYDVSDQPTHVAGGPGGDVSYLYDGLMKRIFVDNATGKDVMNIYDHAGQLAGIYRSGSEYTDHIRANGMLVATVERSGGGYPVARWTPTFRAGDHLGSTQAGFGTDGLLTFQEYYTPYGEVENASPANGDKVGFTGHIRDKATGLNYMQARYQDPVTGRFLSIDPVTYLDTAHPGMFNRYSYTINDPINLTDPTGECPWCIVIAAVYLADKAWGAYDAAQTAKAVANGDISAIDAVASQAGSQAGGLIAGPVGRAGVKVAQKVTSRIGESKKAIRAAEKAGRNQVVQKDIDNLTKKLKEGNLNPGISTKSVGGGVSEARGRNGGRVLFREAAEGIEILGKSGKNPKNQQDAIEAAKEIIIRTR